MRDVVFTRHSVWLAEIDGDIVGFASRDGAWLMNLCTEAGMDGHGIGTQLLRAMPRERGERGAGAPCLCVRAQ